MKKSILWFLCLNLVLILDAQEARTENNGNLILEDIPIIPQSIKDDLSNFRVFAPRDLEVLTMKMEYLLPQDLEMSVSSTQWTHRELHDNKLLFFKSL